MKLVLIDDEEEGTKLGKLKRIWTWTRSDPGCASELLVSQQARDKAALDYVGGELPPASSLALSLIFTLVSGA